MCRCSILFRFLLPALLVACIPAAAQLPGAEPDPLARIREAAKGNTQACSVTGESLCEQVAPKIVANAQGDSPLTENLRRLRDLREKVRERTDGTAASESIVGWGVSAFRGAGLEVHTERYASQSGGPADRENVVAEIRGREKPEEWILVGARLDSEPPGKGVLDSDCNAAMLIEAARDIFLTGIRPRRSIRFVLFTGEGQPVPGSWAYIQAHQDELNRARAAILFEDGCGRITGYSLNGRQDIESGVREAMKPIESLGANHYDLNAPAETLNFDLLLEGIPTLVADRENANSVSDPHAAPEASTAVDLQALKRNTAIAAVTAFGIAELSEPPGPRQTREQITALLKSSGLEKQMKASGLWPLWESGKRGRLQ